MAAAAKYQSVIDLAKTRGVSLKNVNIEQLQQEKKRALMKAGLQTLYHLGAKDALAAHWDTIPLQTKSAYFNSIYDITEERLDEMSCLASFAVQDAADEIRKEGRSLKRRILLHEDAKRYADIFPAKDVVKSAGLDKPHSITLRTDETLRFDAADGGYLEVHRGIFTVDLSAQYQHKARDWDDTDVADVGIQVSDHQGDVWETHFRVAASVVFDTVLGTSAQRYYRDIPEDYRQAFRDHMLLRGHSGQRAMQRGNPHRRREADLPALIPTEGHTWRK